MKRGGVRGLPRVPTMPHASRFGARARGLLHWLGASIFIYCNSFSF